jgi:outer membrane biogenesis lipoprotein LolB
MMLQRTWRAWGATLASALALSGCAQFNDFFERFNQKNAVFAPQVLTPALPKPFQLSGRISIAWDTQRWIGAIEWDYATAIETLALSLAGQDFAHFERYEGKARAKLVNGQAFEENSWSDLTARAIGVALPFEYAPYWVRGEPAPQGEVSARAENEFTQREWVVSTLARDENNRPTRMRWQRDKVSLTLVIDAWNAR